MIALSRAVLRLEYGRLPSVWQSELMKKVMCCTNTVRATPPISRPPSAPTQPFHKPPSSAGSAKPMPIAMDR